MDLDDLHHRVLNETLLRMRQIEAIDLPKGAFPHRVRELEDMKSDGPEYQVGKWFPDDRSGAFQKRAQRHIRDLESFGLLRIVNNSAGRMSCLRLTEEGRQLAERQIPADSEVSAPAAAQPVI